MLKLLFVQCSLFRNRLIGKEAYLIEISEFGVSGCRMFSGDNAGVIIEWNVTVGDKSSQFPTRFWRIERVSLFLWIPLL